MSPFLRALAVYSSEPCVRSFDEDFAAHRDHGFVFITPLFFIMGRPVISTAPAARIVDPRVIFPNSCCDCWHIYLFAGEMKGAWNIMPWPLPLFSFERKNELRLVKAESMRRLSAGNAGLSHEPASPLLPASRFSV